MLRITLIFLLYLYIIDGKALLKFKLSCQTREEREN